MGLAVCKTGFTHVDSVSIEPPLIVAANQSLGSTAPLTASFHDVERLIRQLFDLQDLNGDGLLDEEEVIQLNTKVEALHRGTDFDLEIVATRCRAVFREGLDCEGRPVPYEQFRSYWTDFLWAHDRRAEAQLMMMEQFVAEADLARKVLLGWPGCSRSLTEDESTTVDDTSNFSVSVPSRAVSADHLPFSALAAGDLSPGMESWAPVDISVGTGGI